MCSAAARSAGEPITVALSRYLWDHQTTARKFLVPGLKVKVSLGALHGMGDAQVECTLLRSCLALPKASMPARWPQPLQCHTPLFSPPYLTQSLWCIKSLAANLPPPHISSAVSRLAIKSARLDWQSLDNIDVPLRQNCLSHVVDESCFQQLLNKAPTSHSRALAFSSSLPHTSDWLNVIPSATLGLHLHDREFQCCLHYWLGVPLLSSPYPCPEYRCTADPFGDHQVSSDGIARHNAVRDVIYAAAQYAALAPWETPGLVPGSQVRPGDIFLPCWSVGHPSAFDVLAISPLQELTITEAAQTPGHALQVGVQRKLTKPSLLGTDFVPLVAETLGGDTIRTITNISRAIEDRCSSSDSVLTSKHLFGRLAVALWRGNVSSGSTASHPSPLSRRLSLTTSPLFFVCFLCS